MDLRYSPVASAGKMEAMPRVCNCIDEMGGARPGHDSSDRAALGGPLNGREAPANSFLNLKPGASAERKLFHDDRA
jgi:hypothetical protein